MRPPGPAGRPAGNRRTDDSASAPTASAPTASAGAPTRSTTAKGRSAEDRAEWFLRERGYEILDRNARSTIGEIDLVAREGGDLVFVEVRSRADDSTGGAEETVGAIKQRRIAAAAAAYLGERALGFDTCRFDVVAITGDDVALFQDAFRLSGESAERY